MVPAGATVTGVYPVLNPVHATGAFACAFCALVCAWASPSQSDAVSGAGAAGVGVGALLVVDVFFAAILKR